MEEFVIVLSPRMSYNLDSRHISFKLPFYPKHQTYFIILRHHLSCVVTHPSYLTHATVIKQSTVYVKLVVATKGQLPQTNDQA